MADVTDVPGIVDVVVRAIDALNTDQSCVVTIENNSNAVLDRMALDCEDGRFVTEPPQRIQPGTKGVFGAADTPGSFAIGVKGFVRYNAGGMGQCNWTLTFSNPGMPILGGLEGNEADTTLAGPEAGHYTDDHFMPEQGSDKVPVRFTLMGGPPHLGPPPGQKPPPTEDKDEVKSSCVVTVMNQTDEPLSLVNQGGSFFTVPGPEIDPQEYDSFGTVETEGAEEWRSAGYVQYRVGGGDTFVTLQWNNPENAENTTDFQVGGADPDRIRVLDQIGAGEENVPVTFTVTAVSGGVPPVPPTENQVEWAPPPEVEQPTLRRGDDNPDGWVEYLQHLLYVDVDGDFGAATERAVRQVQADYDIQVDGVVGYQTWAVLRGETPAPASTDGRAPHSHVEGAAEARWTFEGDLGTYYDPDVDTLFLPLTSVGTELPVGQEATVRFVGDDTGEVRVTRILIEDPDETHPGGGADYTLEATGLRDLCGAGTHTVEAYLPADLGGDYITFQVRIEEE
jgi:peptidoglycan hydrolase-like protein with peptidoglycan-binding domain